MGNDIYFIQIEPTTLQFYQIGWSNSENGKPIKKMIKINIGVDFTA